MDFLKNLPFVKIVLPFILGVIAQYLLGYYNENLWGLFFVFGIGLNLIAPIIFSFRLRWIFGMFLSVFLFLLGFLRMGSESELNNKLHFSYKLKEGQNSFSAKIVSFPEHKQKSVLVLLEVSDLYDESQGIFFNCSGKLLCYIANDSLSEELNYGDIIFARSHLNPIVSNVNPYAFDYKTYLNQKNIHFQSFIKANQWSWKTNYLTPFEELKVYLNSFRQKLLMILKEQIPNGANFAVASALILGDKSNLSQEIKDSYSNSGAMHVLAVSGLHVGVIYLIISLLFRLFLRNRAKFFQIFFSIFLIWVFALITGGSPSVLRAATMFSIILLASLLRRHVNVYHSIALSGFILLLINPFLLFELGFQLSYLALTSIVYFQPKINRLFFIENKLLYYVWTLVSVSLAAQIATIPLTIFYFHKVPLFSWLSGIVVVPSAFAILLLGVLLFIFSGFYGITLFIAFLLNTIICFTNYCIDSINQIPMNVLDDLWINSVQFITLYLILVCTVFALNTRKGYWLILGNLFIIMYICLSSYIKLQKTNEVSVSILHLKNSSCINFKFKQINSYLYDKNISSYDLKNTLRNHASYYGTPYQEISNFQARQYPYLSLQDHYIRTPYFDALLIQGSEIHIPLLSDSLEFILLRNNPSIDVRKLINYFNFKIIVIDGSNSFTYSQKLQKELISMGVPFYNTSEGAFKVIF